MFAQDCAEGRSGGMKLDVYENLRRINRGFELVIEGLAALRKHGVFHRDTLARFAALSKENRSATNSSLTSVIESAETDEAGRRFRERKAPERASEDGPCDSRPTRDLVSRDA